MQKSNSARHVDLAQASIGKSKFKSQWRAILLNLIWSHLPGNYSICPYLALIRLRFRQIGTNYMFWYLILGFLWLMLIKRQNWLICLYKYRTWHLVKNIEEILWINVIYHLLIPWFLQFLAQLASNCLKSIKINPRF